MRDHEYSVIGGFNRANIGRLIGALAAGLSAGVHFVVAWAAQKAATMGHPISFALRIPLTAGIIFVVLYWYFNREFWKLALVSKWLKVPNLSGDWDCEGQTINPDHSPGAKWNGVVRVSQSWDKIRVHLKTAQSSSDSVTASLVHDVGEGFRLMYSYRNEPKITEKELKAHYGYAAFAFDEDLQVAEGEYFNGNGRYTFGTMKLKRKV